METHDTVSHPWNHPYYILIKDMYNPFMYHNQYYCELSDQEVARMLSERDTYVRITDSEDGYIELTSNERSWVVYLRNCCLFEIHRRKYKFVLTDIIKIRYRDLKDVHQSKLSAHRKVSEWIKSNSASFINCEYQFLTDNEPEVQANHCPTCLDKTTQCPSDSESTDSADSTESTVSELDGSTYDQETEILDIAKVRHNVQGNRLTANPLTVDWQWLEWPEYSGDSFGSGREDIPAITAAHASTSTNLPGPDYDPTLDFEESFMNLLFLQTEDVQQNDIVQ